MFNKCKHENSETITNIYGDSINWYTPTFSNKIYRSQRECLECGKIYFSEYLDRECKKVNKFY